MEHLQFFIDFETRSRADIKKDGLANYISQAEVLMLSYAVNEQAPQIWLAHEGPLPEYVEMMLRRPEILKVAFNCEFERTVLAKLLKIETPLRAWDDPMLMARYASIGGGLDYVGRVLGLPDDKAKLAAGKKLIRLFCIPKKDGTFNDHLSHPAEFAQFVEYCKQDVRAEREIFRKLKAFHLPKFEQDIRDLTLEMNERGIHIDKVFLDKASEIVSIEEKKLAAEMRELTGVSNPNSPAQLLKYLQSQGYIYHSIGKKFVEKAKSEIAITKDGKQCLNLREQLAKSSTKKLASLKNFTSPDGYLRHTFSYYGAPRTGRWSARGPQLQNFPRGGIKADIYDGVVESIRNFQDIENILKYGAPLDIVSSCLRSAVRAPGDQTLRVADLSAIDSRTLAWLAKCETILRVYRQGLDLYTTFGMEFYKRSYDELRHDKLRRAINKVIVLSCGYGLGGGEEKENKDGDIVRTGLWKITTDAGLDLPQDECHRAVKLFRDMYSEIPTLWRSVEYGAIDAIRSGENQQVGYLTIGCVKPCRLLWLQLPSARRLHFIRPRLETEERWDGFERTILTHEDNLINKQWGVNRTYGGAIVGVATQAVARDIYGYGLLQAKAAGFHFGALIHDEGVCSESDPRLTHELLAEKMTTKAPWVDELLPLAAESFESVIYKKG